MNQDNEKVPKDTKSESDSSDANTDLSGRGVAGSGHRDSGGADGGDSSPEDLSSENVAEGEQAPTSDTDEIGRPERRARSGYQRYALLTFEFLIGFTLIIALGVGAMLWRLGEHPIRADSLVEPVTSAINARLDGVAVTIEELLIIRDADRGVGIRVTDVRVHDALGREIVASPNARVYLDIVDLVLGRVSLTGFQLMDAHVTVLVDNDGRSMIVPDGGKIIETLELNNKAQPVRPSSHGPVGTGRALGMSSHEANHADPRAVEMHHHRHNGSARRPDPGSIDGTTSRRPNDMGDVAETLERIKHSSNTLMLFDPSIAPAEDRESMVSAILERATSVSDTSTGASLEVGLQDATISLIHETTLARVDMKVSASITREQQILTYRTNLEVKDAVNRWVLDLAGSLRGDTDGYLLSVSTNSVNPAAIADTGARFWVASQAPNPHKRHLDRELGGERLMGFGPFGALDLPIETRAEFRLSREGHLHWGEFAHQLSAGHLHLQHHENANALLLDEGEINWRFDQSPGRSGATSVQISSSQLWFGFNKLNLSGELMTSADNSERWEFELRGDGSKLAFDPNSTAPILFDVFGFRGWLDSAARQFELEHAEMQSGDAYIVAHVKGRQGEISPIIDAGLEISRMDVRRLTQLWPPIFASKLHAWISENIHAGQIGQSRIKLHFADGVIPDIIARKPLPPEIVNLDFSFHDLALTFVKGMPALEAASGAGEIVDGHFVVSTAREALIRLPSGRAVAVDRVTVEIPEVTARPAIVDVQTHTRSGLLAAMEFLNHPPVALLAKSGIPREGMRGDSEISVALSLPLVRGLSEDDINLSATAQIRDFSSLALFEGRDIRADLLEVDVSNQRFNLSGTGFVDDTPMNIRLARHLGQRQTSEQNQPIEELWLQARLGDDHRQQLGLALPFLRGPVELTVTSSNILSSPDPSVLISADISEARIADASVPVEKAAGDYGMVRFTGARSNHGFKISDLEVAVGELRLAGDIRLRADYSLEAIELSHVQMASGDAARLSLVRAANGATGLSIKGKRLSVGSIIASQTATGATRSPSSNANANANAVNQQSGPFAGEINIRELVGQNGVVLRNAKSSIVLKGDGRIERLSVSGQFRNGPLTLTIQRNQDTNQRLMELMSKDAGAVLRFTGLYKRMHNGALNLSQQLPDDNETVGVGLFNVYEFNIRDEPVLRLFSAAAPQSEGTDKIGGDVYFKRLRMPYTVHGSVMRIGDSHVRGPAVGSTLRGSIDFARKHVDLTGTFVPLYMLNNLLSKIPVVGGILTGGKREGIFGMNFAIRGDGAPPKVTVNPASAITPGIFRKVFDFTGNAGSNPSPGGAGRTDGTGLSSSGTGTGRTADPIPPAASGTGTGRTADPIPPAATGRASDPIPPAATGRTSDPIPGQVIDR